MGEHDGTHDGPLTARAIAVRTTLSATAAELHGEWDEVEFLAHSVALLPEPEEVAWAAMYLTKANFSLVEPMPDADDVAAAAAACASHGFAPDGAAYAAGTFAATAVRSLLLPGGVDPAPLLVASAGAMLLETPKPSVPMAAGLFSAVAYAFVRSAMALDRDPAAEVERLIATLP